MNITKCRKTPEETGKQGKIIIPYPAAIKKQATENKKQDAMKQCYFEDGWGPVMMTMFFSNCRTAFSFSGMHQKPVKKIFCPGPGEPSCK
jgi:hypothetical protein